MRNRQQTSIRRSVLPTEQPVEIDDLRKHLGTDEEAREDAYILGLLKAATYAVENKIERTLLTTTWVMTLDHFPNESWNKWNDIFVPFGPIATISDIEYYDTDGAQQTLVEGTDFRMDNNSVPSRIRPIENSSWPSVQNRAGAITITFIAGETSKARITDDIKTWIMLYVDDMYRVRGSVNPESISGDSIRAVRKHYDILLDPYRSGVKIIV